MSIDIYTPSEDNEPKRDFLDTVNDRIKVNNKEGSELTIQDIAKKLGVGSEMLTIWVESDEGFKKGLEGYMNMQDDGTIDAVNNRVDDLMLTTLISDMKKKHKK